MKKILIVDDEEMMLMVAKRILSGKYDIVCASSGEEAIGLYEKEKPDMILSDLIMPHMNGFEMHEILQQKYGSQIPVMFMTADDSDEAEGRGFKSGAQDFIRKPFRPDVLLGRVDNIFNNIEIINTLTEEASTDKLTGFLNKESINRKLSEICAAEQGAFLIVDLDSFKLVNDIYGHDMGDKVLVAFAEVIRNVICDDDTVGRIGGDEFVVFCKNILEEKTIASIVRNINEQLIIKAKGLMGDNFTIPLGVSVGAVFVPKQGTDYAELFNMADKALYYVKQNEKHGYSLYTQKYTPDDYRHGESSAETMQRLSMVFEERNISDSAFWLGQDAFGQVFRFMMRYIQSYRGVAYKALFTVTSLSEDISSQEFSAMVEQFGEVLNRSLRKSDIMTRCSANQYFLLLPEIYEQYIKKVLDRVMEHWNSTDSCQKAKITYEIENICAEELDERERRRK